MRRCTSERLRGTVLLSLAIMLVGCVDLSEVGKFADLSTTVAVSFPTLVADIEGSCKRRAVYAPKDKREDVLNGCKDLAASRDGLLKAQEVLLDYMEALKNLSADDSITYGKKLDALPGALSKSGFDGKQVEAATGLAKKIADAALNGYRRRRLAELVGATNDEVQTVTAALRTIVTQDYVRELRLEDEGATAFYRTAIASYGQREPLTEILVERAYAADEHDLAEREKAAEAYGKFMESIAKGHQKLYDSRHDWSTQTLLRELGPVVEDLYDSAHAVHVAFK